MYSEPEQSFERTLKRIQGVKFARLLAKSQTRKLSNRNQAILSTGQDLKQFPKS